MKPEAEDYLWARISVAGQHVGQPSPREVIAEMHKQGMMESLKQGLRTLEKWSRKGIYDYGVSLDLGWKYADAPQSCRPVNTPGPSNVEP